MIVFACPECGDTYQVEPGQAGQAAKCSRCATCFTIPASNAPPSPAPVPPPLPKSQPTGQVEIQPCPVCGTRAQVEAADIGHKVECPGCLSSYEAVEVNPRPKPTPSQSEAKKSKEPKRSKRRWDDEDRDEDDYDDRPKKRKRPSNITAIAALLLAGGIYGLIFGCLIGLNALCLWPGTWYAVVWSIFAIIRGSTMLNERDISNEPRTLVIMQIIMIVNCDVVNMIMGIVGLVLLNDAQVVKYYERLRERYE
jgi:hypothetical protein